MSERYLHSLRIYNIYKFWKLTYALKWGISLPWKHMLLHRSNQCVYQFWIHSVHNWRILKTYKKRVLFDVTWHNNGTSYAMAAYTTSYGTSYVIADISFRNILQSTRSLYDFQFKSYGPNGVFLCCSCFGDLDHDRWPIFYFWSHKVGMKYRSLHAKFY